MATTIREIMAHYGWQGDPNEILAAGESMDTPIERAWETADDDHAWQAGQTVLWDIGNEIVISNADAVPDDGVSTDYGEGWEEIEWVG